MFNYIFYKKNKNPQTDFEQRGKNERKRSMEFSIYIFNGHDRPNSRNRKYLAI